MVNMKNYIVYIHVNNKSNEVFYVGLGKMGRHREKLKRSSEWNDIVKSDGFTPIVIFDDLTLDEADELERFLIAEYGRVCEGTGKLVNKTSGGQRTTHSEKSKELMRQIALNRGYSESERKLASTKCFERLQDEEFVEYHRMRTQLNTPKRENHPRWNINSYRNIGNRLGVSYGSIKNFLDRGTLEQEIIRRGFLVNEIIINS